MNTQESLTKDAVTRYVKRNRNELDTVIFSGTPTDDLREQYIEQQMDYHEEYGYEIAQDEEDGNYYIYLNGEPMVDYPYGTHVEANDALKSLIERDAELLPDWELRELMGEDDNDGSSQYLQYTAPGGSDYTETLVKLSNRAEDHFDDPHFDNQENTLLHIRTKSRVDNQGRNLLFIEELQSDWHQKGRSEGYDNPPVKGVARQLDPENYNNRFTIDWEDGRQTENLTYTSLERAQEWADQYGGRAMAGGVPDAGRLRGAQKARSAHGIDGHEELLCYWRA